MKVLFWLVLVLICWPLALVVLVLYPIVWLVLLPFRVVGITMDAVLALLRQFFSCLPGFWAVRGGNPVINVTVYRDRGMP